MRILFALLSALVGLTLLFGGYRLARLVIPIMGFLAGLSLGGAVIADSSSVPFLGTALGIVVGLTAGLVLAVLAYLSYSVAVVVLAGSLGYWAGSSFILWLGFSPGLISVLVGIGIGVAVGLAALMLNAPKYLLIAFTAMAGAVATVGGVLLLFNTIPLNAYSYTTASLSIGNSFVWSMVTLVLLVMGITAQAKTTSDYEFEEWAAMQQGNHAPPTTTPHAPKAS